MRRCAAGTPNSKIPTYHVDEDIAASIRCDEGTGQGWGRIAFLPMSLPQLTRRLRWRLQLAQLLPRQAFGSFAR
jgi:hypothetical protein